MNQSRSLNNAISNIINLFLVIYGNISFRGGGEVAIGVALLILIGALLIGYKSSSGMSEKRKLITWGIATMIGIAPFLSWLVGISFGVYVGDGFAGAGVMVIMFVILFFIGLITLLVGIFKKNTDNM